MDKDHRPLGCHCGLHYLAFPVGAIGLIAVLLPAVMQERKKRLRRVELAVPASNERMMAKAAGSNADFVFLDLEDAVAPKAKVEARAKAVEALKSLDWSGKTRCVRINDLGTEWAFEDIITVVEPGAGPAGVAMSRRIISRTR